MERTNEAYAMLGTTPEAVAQLPVVTPILESSFPGGVPAAIGYLRTSDNKDARKFLKAYDLLTPTQRDRLPFEAFCAVESLSPPHILGLIVETCYASSTAASSIIAAISHPQVVKATVEAALSPDGHADRKMLHLNRGFVPVPKNQTTIFSHGSHQANIQNNAQTVIQQNQQNYTPGSVAAIENKLSKITDRYNQRMGLVPVDKDPDEPEPIDVEPNGTKNGTATEPTEPEPESEGWD